METKRKPDRDTFKSWWRSLRDLAKEKDIPISEDQEAWRVYFDEGYSTEDA